MRFALSTILWCSILSAFAQTGIITGKVTDNKKTPLPFASVYINQTTIGTTTEVDGKFTLRAPEGEQDLVVSFVGFQTFQASVKVDDSVAVELEIQLLPSITAMKEVQINSKKDKRWEQQYEKFKRLFFGANGAAQCRILNPWVLEFEDGPAGRLVANADESMEIENMNLGYRISYLLKTFDVGSIDFNIVGLARFHELEAGDQALKDLWTSRRTQAYLGSTRHFLKSVIENRDMQEGFQLFVDVTNNVDVVRNQSFSLNINESIYPYNMIGKVLPGFYDGRHTVRFPPRLEVHYRRKAAAPTVYANVSWPVSWMEVDGGTLYLNKQGVPLNASRLTTMGAMSEARVAEILPYDYEPRRGEKVSGKSADSVATAPVLALSGLLEKPYLHLNKPYYYHSDIIFFKAYMNYVRPVIRDTLSRVLYVDLVGSDGRILTSRTLPIVNGMASGDFLIGPDFPEGDLQIRAYTRWMLNYGNEIIFKKPVKVIADNQLGKPGISTAERPKGINVMLEKDTYGTREKVTMMIEAIDALDMPVASNLSISVTDAEQAVRPSSESTIVNTFPFSERDVKASAAFKQIHKIQYGIPFSGKFRGKKKTQLSGEIRLVQNSTDVPLTLVADEKGEFSHELQLMDSMELYMEAVTPRGKPANVTLDSVNIPRPGYTPVSPLAVEFYTPSDQSKVHVADALASARMLKAVTVTERRINPRPEKPFNVDVAVDKEWLRSTLAVDLLSALQRRVPGLRIVYKMSPGGLVPIKYIVFTGNFSFDGGAQEPLVIVDGLPVQADEGSMAEKLAQIMVAEIENVEVLKSGNAALYGARGSNGVIIVNTSRGPSESVSTQQRDLARMQLVKLPGYSTVSKFEAPDYSIRKDEDTDVRSTIYWNPNVVTTGKEPAIITFYTADLPGTYRIVVEGLTTDGSPVRAERIIQVTRD